MELVNIKEIKDVFSGRLFNNDISIEILDIIENEPIVHLALLMHAKWEAKAEDIDDTLCCSHCHTNVDGFNEDYSYCPHCGCTMDNNLQLNKNSNCYVNFPHLANQINGMLFNNKISFDCYCKIIGKETISVPDKQATWRKTYLEHVYECSDCGAAYKADCYHYHYCPNCGKEMTNSIQYVTRDLSKEDRCYGTR